MDKIYLGASVTIVNALSGNADARIPGISLVYKRSHISVGLPEYEQGITMVTNVQKEISIAKWSCRA
jgi:hypothetical protein